MSNVININTETEQIEQNQNQIKMNKTKKKEITCPLCQYNSLTVYFDKDTRRNYWYCPQCQTTRQMSDLQRTIKNQNQNQNQKTVQQQQTVQQSLTI